MTDDETEIDPLRVAARMARAGITLVRQMFRISFWRLHLQQDVVACEPTLSQYYKVST
jgi:hypothetical protein